MPAAKLVIPDQSAAAILAALQSFVDNPDGEPLLLIRNFLIALKPPRRYQERDASLYWNFMLQTLQENNKLREALRDATLRLFATRKQVSFYTDSGLLPDTGFFTELSRILTHKLLPELRDTTELRSCIAELFPSHHDQRWFTSVSREDRRALWVSLDILNTQNIQAQLTIVGDVLDASIVLSHRIAAMGLSPELARVYPRLRQAESPFVAMNVELCRFVDSFRSALLGRSPSDPDHNINDGEHLFVLLEQCQDTLRRIHSAASRLGTSMSLSFTLNRMAQHLERLTLLLHFITTAKKTDDETLQITRWSDFLMNTFEGERQHNSLRRHFSNLVSLLALRITDNAAHTGEHYIANTRAEWFNMLWRAAGAGIFIALLAFLKIQSVALHLAPAPQAWLNAIIYASGFAVIYSLNFIIATKQPAMTAATLASSISSASRRLKDTEKIVDLMAATFRSQLAAVAGNIMVAFPLAILFLMLLHLGTDTAWVSAEKARHLLAEVKPLQGHALTYAAIAGVWLFTAGIVSGYLDNRAVYMQLGPRIAQLGWLRTLLGANYAQKTGHYLAAHAGGLGGNVFFGLMLGLTPLIGNWFGLTLDIRHIAFSSANIGYAMVALDFALPGYVFVAAIFSVLLVGIINLSVSFALALWVAMRSRRLSFWLLAPVMPHFFRRLLNQPGNFFLPPPRTPEAD